MGDILQGLFSALPMAILQYINNDVKGYWYAEGNKLIKLFVF